MGNINKFIILAIFLVSITSVYSAPPQQQATGLYIFYPQYDQLKVDTPFTLHTHVLDVATGLGVTNATTNCFLHLYNETGKHTLERNMSWDSNNVEFKLDINAGNFSRLGNYEYIIQCQSATKGGAVSGQFKVTTSGLEDPDVSESIIYSLCILIFTTIFILSLVGSFAIDGKNKYVMGDYMEINYAKYFKFGLFAVSYLSLWALTLFTQIISDKFFNMTFMSNFLLFVFKTMGYLMIPFIALISVVAFVDWLADIKLEKEASRGLKPR